MSDLMKNKDRDENHCRRRDLDEGEDDPDGREVVAALYGRPADSDRDDEDDGTQ